MATQGCWLAARRYFTICKHLYPQPWAWNHLTSTAVPTPSSLLIPWYIMNSGLIFLCTSTIVLILQKILHGNQNDPNFSTRVALVWAIVGAATFLIAVISCTLIAKKLEMCSTMTQMNYVFTHLTPTSKKALRDKDWKWTKDIVGVAMHIMIVGFLAGAALGFIYPLVFKGDPGFFILRGLGNPFSPRIGKLVRSLSQGKLIHKL